jgi:hypothetical protein
VGSLPIDCWRLENPVLFIDPLFTTYFIEVTTKKASEDEDLHEREMAIVEL